MAAALVIFSALLAAVNGAPSLKILPGEYEQPTMTQFLVPHLAFRDGGLGSASSSRSNAEGYVVSTQALIASSDGNQHLVDALIASTNPANHLLDQSDSLQLYALSSNSKGPSRLLSPATTAMLSAQIPEVFFITSRTNAGIMPIASVKAPWPQDQSGSYLEPGSFEIASAGSQIHGKAPNVHSPLPILVTPQEQISEDLSFPTLPHQRSFSVPSITEINPALAQHQSGKSIPSNTEVGLNPTNVNSLPASHKAHCASYLCLTKDSSPEITNQVLNQHADIVKNQFPPAALNVLQEPNFNPTSNPNSPPSVQLEDTLKKIPGKS